MPKIPVILVGGFLGAGKTTLIQAATEKLAAQGKRVGIVTNDQAANLVDTATLARPGLPIQEVSGGCFCCHFDDLVGAMDRLVEADAPDVLIGEPVGSCTDLSATVLQPMKQLLADRYEAAPFSVLVDATRLQDALGKGDGHRFPKNVIYIYRKQLEEADVIVLNKADLLLGCEVARLEDSLRREFPQAMVMTISALRKAERLEYLGIDDVDVNPNTLDALRGLPTFLPALKTIETLQIDNILEQETKRSPSGKETPANTDRGGVPWGQRVLGSGRE
ncbi:MAG: GTP-binding protein [Thermoguttaceae bacterium]|jgi:G3E family GTPase|nr:GTP-binding protein [Thermoguttaceae bacterium]